MKLYVQVIEVNTSEVRVEFIAGKGGQTQRGFLIKSEGINHTPHPGHLQVTLSKLLSQVGQLSLLSSTGREMSIPIRPTV